MCGIVGLYSFKNNVLNKKHYINDCLKLMNHRGPDSTGIWTNDLNYIAGFVRLAIRDLSPCGNQPMVSSCGNYCLSFNGEIYNSDKYISVLMQKGVQFRSSSDTEVLLNALIYLGVEKVLEEFDGMFAFAFYNKEKNILVLARDRLGIKPLYIGFDSSDDIIYSSQYDHIIHYGNLQKEPFNYEAIGSYLQLGYVPDNLGIVNKTFLFPHGHYAVITDTSFNLHSYYFYSYSSKENSDSESFFSNSVHQQLVSDAPVGTFLSGGTDSSLVTYWANRKHPVTAFTAGNNDPVLDEKKDASWFTDKFNIPHYIQDIAEKDLVETIDNNFKAFSEPFADFSSLPLLLISNYARKYVKVILSGDGPDELFWGYDRNLKALSTGKKFFQPKSFLFAQGVTERILNRKSYVNKRMIKSKNFFDFYYNSMFTYGGEVWINKIYKVKPIQAWFLNQIKNKYEGKPVQDEYMNIVRDIEMHIHLQRILLKVDRTTMYHSLEARVPYLSNDILDASSRMNFTQCIQNGHGKYNLKKILLEKTNEHYVYKQKKGFLVPMHTWLRKALRKDVEDKLMNMPSELAVAFNKKYLEQLLDAHMNGKQDYSGIIWAVYALVNWHYYHRNK